jgi:Ni,Fe-hydrogenase III small subunit
VVVVICVVVVVGEVATGGGVVSTAARVVDAVESVLPVVLEHAAARTAVAARRKTNLRIP